MIDAYAHIGLPRFLSAEQMLRVMDAHDVEKMMVSTAKTCADLHELSRAAASWPDRFRCVGLPLGRDAADRIANVRRQMQAGFSGIRIGEGLIVEQPELLEVIGQAGGTPVVLGTEALAHVAATLADFLDRYGDCFVCAPHFAAPASPAVLDADQDVARLFGDPRFLVVFSRHGAFPEDLLQPWASALVARVGWGRILFGSEYPVAQWRNESYQSTVDWVSRQPFAPSADDRKRYLQDNAERTLFARPPRPVTPFDESGTLRAFGFDAAVWLFPHDTVDLPEPVHHRLLSAYLDEPVPPTEPYTEFVARVIQRGLDRA